jgi:hypothetical protein
MLITVGSWKGAPFVTSLALGLAARWPQPGAVVVEADPAGGDLALRFGHHREPGLSALAADTRAGGGGRDLDAYTQRLVLGVDVVFAPADRRVDGRVDGPGEAAQAVRLLARNCLGLLGAAAARRLVVVDVGRLGWDSPALPLVCAADVLLLVSAAGLEGIDAVQVRRDRLLGLAGMWASVRLVLAGRAPFPVREIARVVGLPVAGQLPEDQRGAAVLAGRARPGRGWTRLELPRAARAIALSLHAEQGGAGRWGGPPPMARPVPVAEPVPTWAAHVAGVNRW